MKAYELLFFLPPILEDQVRLEVIERVKEVITSNEGQVDNVDEWGKRKLAYEINNLTEGDYVLVDFHAKPEFISELDRVLRINDHVQRHMITSRSDRD